MADAIWHGRDSIRFYAAANHGEKASQASGERWSETLRISDLARDLCAGTSRLDHPRPAHEKGGRSLSGATAAVRWMAGQPRLQEFRHAVPRHAIRDHGALDAVPEREAAGEGLARRFPGAAEEVGRCGPRGCSACH